MADTNIKAYANFENLFKDGDKVTDFREIELTLESKQPDSNGEYTFVKTLDIPCTSWHYPNHELSIDVRSVNTNNDAEDTKSRADYSSGSSLNGLFRSVEKDVPTISNPSDSEDYCTSVLDVITITANDNNEDEWYKNSGIKKDDGLTLKIFKDKGTTDLFNENFLSKPIIDNGTFTWNYSPQGGFDDGSWEIILTVTDNDGNSTSLTKKIKVDTKAPELKDINLSKDSILGERTFSLTGQTDQEDSNVTVVVKQRDNENITKTFAGKSKSDGSFSINIELFEGYNIVVVTVTEAGGLGLFSTVTIENIFVDTAAPDIVSVTTSPIAIEGRPGQLIITVKVRV